MSAELDGGGSTGDGATTTTSDGETVIKSWLLPDVLETLANSPQAFVVGAILSWLLGGLEDLVTTIIDAIQFVFLGSDPSSTAGVWGLADVAPGFAGLVIDSLRPLGNAILAIPPILWDIALAIGEPFGPAGVLVATAIGVGYVVALVKLARIIAEILIDVIPGGGALLK